jgi:hypothetical protein
MDTYEARIAMRELADGALKIVEHVASELTGPTAGEKSELRRLAVEARSLLPDAGYPGEAAWRVLQRSSMGADTAGLYPDDLFWADIVQELHAAMETLDALVSTSAMRESDFYIVG